jgi:hypothetical protein
LHYAVALIEYFIADKQVNTIMAERAACQLFPRFQFGFCRR